jgi:hypothetical protein
LIQKTGSERFANMDRYHGGSTVRMSHEMMTSFYPNNQEPEFLESLERLSTGDARQATHTSTATRWTPTNSDDT